MISLFPVPGFNMAFITRGIWFFKGLKEYTKSGFEKARATFRPEDLDDADMNGHTVMITGANSGIGKCVATALAKLGAEVHLICRNPSSAEEAKKEISAATGNPNVHIHTLDMSLPRDVTRFAQWFVREGKSLDVLVNNAGCMVHTRQTDADGLELNFATNTLGTHLLTMGLLPALKKATNGKARVVVVSSGGMLTQRLDVNDLQTEKKAYDGTAVYAQNKRQQVIMVELYAKKYPEVFFASMHPGWADTPAVRSAMPGFYERMKDRLRTAEQGADTVVWLSAAKSAVDQPSGSFFQDRQPVATHLPMSRTRVTPADEEKLMTILDEYYMKFKE
ncbi:unnamed protein product [Notodromas monacha]|uniref:Dehydrogenase/reductase SDR family member 12 n=1 Tax=Notodromas monacha TaxID=399045 RepID=A0A7R9BES0_9CRUS|nr:unnamed protein product [Notodromas monacha]CAG0914038.1 unnamed protein product [Notodromas monacha]